MQTVLITCLVAAAIVALALALLIAFCSGVKWGRDEWECPQCLRGCMRYIGVVTPDGRYHHACDECGFVSKSPRRFP